MAENFIEESCAEIIDLLNGSAIQKALLGRKVMDILELMQELGEPLGSQLTRVLYSGVQHCFRDYQAILNVTDRIERQLAKDRQEIHNVIDQLGLHYLKEEPAKSEEPNMTDNLVKFDEMFHVETPIEFQAPDKLDDATSTKPPRYP